MTNPTTFAVGDRVIIQNRGGGWDGVTGTVKTVKPGVIWVDYDDPKSTPLGDGFEGGSWTTDQEFIYVSRLVESEVTQSVAGQGPKASLTHDTSKDYAQHADSRESVEVERTSALIREKTDLEVKVEDLEASLHEASEQIARADKRLEHLYTECNEFHAALEYAFSLLSSENQSRLAGFRDGYGTRVNDEH